ncbi:MAG: cell envelope integrity protein TolA, partial [Steroidobacteraceae bacterium]
KAAADKAAATKAAAEKAAAEKAAADKAAAEKAEADKAAADKAAAAAAAAAKAEADRKAQQLAQQKKIEQERAQQEADLRSQLANEEHVNAVQSSPAKAEYLALITARINRAWIRPPSARAGVKCSLHITQIPGGEVTNVVVTGCNGDESVRQSVETAAYRASPLPAPPDPALFDPNIDVTFAPDE